MALLLSVPRSDMCLNLFCLTTVMWLFQLCHQFFPGLLCVKNVCCLTAVRWMFQVCHHLFPDLLCVRISVAPQLSCEYSNCAITCFQTCCVRMSVAPLLSYGFPNVPSVVPRPVMCQNVCCPTAVTWMFQQCHHLFQHLLRVVWICVVYCSLK